MFSIERVVPERLAMLVHHYREALAPDFGCRPSTNLEWEDLPPQERSRMVAAARLALLDIRSTGVQMELGDKPGVVSASEGKECGC